MQKIEQESTATYAAADEVVRIYSCIPADVRALERDERFTKVDGGVYADGNPWGEFTIPAARWSPVTGAKKRFNLTEEQKQIRSDRLAEMRRRQSEAN